MRRLAPVEQFAFPELSISAAHLNFRTLARYTRFFAACDPFMASSQRGNRVINADTKFPGRCSFSNHSVLFIHSSRLNSCVSRALAAPSTFQSVVVGPPAITIPTICGNNRVGTFCLSSSPPPCKPEPTIRQSPMRFIAAILYPGIAGRAVPARHRR